MDQKELYQMHAEFCKFMGNAKRIEILFLLGQRELCVDELAAAMAIKVPNISQHLAVMREKGVVKVRRDGTKMYYSIVNPKTLEACVIIRDAMIEQIENKLELVKTQLDQS